MPLERLALFVVDKNEFKLPLDQGRDIRYCKGSDRRNA